MASLEKRHSVYRVVFRLGGNKYCRSLRTRSEKVALASVARLEDNLRRVELGTLSIPEDADVPAFLLSDGRTNGKQKPQKRIPNLNQLVGEYLDSVPDNSVEESTLRSIRTHRKHLIRILGSTYRLAEMSFDDLQSYVDKRAKEKSHLGKRISATTIRKELVTLNTVWRWATRMGYVTKPLPKGGLRFPKVQQKPRFQTWQEIEWKIERGGFSEKQQAELWDSLFLTLPEIERLLDHVQEVARHPFIYPMLVFLAYTGARRSEMIRSRIEDIDLQTNNITIREKKRVRGALTTRTVPMSPLLSDVLGEWLYDHPGGQFTFAVDGHIERSRSHRKMVSQLTQDLAHDHFKRTLADSMWSRIRGFHVLRHSFCSNAAAAGVDQRIINGWVGHQTEDMVRRYRHLIPNVQQNAIQQVFDVPQQA